MSEYDLTYFAMRAETERALADKSATPEIAALHITMAERYEALVSTRAVRVPPRIVGGKASLAG